VERRVAEAPARSGARITLSQLAPRRMLLLHCLERE
jgi:hypothetical protein